MDTAQQKSWSAWGLSLLLHVLLVVLLGLGLQGAPRGPQVEPDRSAGIVLAQRGAEERIRYFDEVESGGTEAASPASDAFSAGLPSDSALLSAPAPDIKLPAHVGVLGASPEALVPEVTLDGGGRRWRLPGDDAAQILAEEAARRLAAGPAGPAASLSLFGGSPAQGRSFVFLIDRSKSMGGAGLDALAAAERELTRAASQLQPEHRFQVIAYHQRCVYLQNLRQLLPATRENIDALGEFFAGLAAFGGTEHFLALQMGLALQPDVLFLLTDGADPYLNDAQLRELEKRAAGRTTIHCIQFGFGPLQEENTFMMRLARRSQGAYHYVQMRP